MDRHLTVQVHNEVTLQVQVQVLQRFWFGGSLGTHTSRKSTQAKLRPNTDPARVTHAASPVLNLPATTANNIERTQGSRHSQGVRTINPSNANQELNQGELHECFTALVDGTEHCKRHVKTAR